MLSRTAELLKVVETGTAVTVVKPWGIERFVDCGEFIVKVIEVHDGHRTSLQYHRVKEEVITILNGTGHVRIEDARVRAGDPPVRIPPLTVHRAVGPVLLLEFTTPENDDVVRIEDDYLGSRT